MFLGILEQYINTFTYTIWVRFVENVNSWKAPDFVWNVRVNLELVDLE